MANEWHGNPLAPLVRDCLGKWQLSDPRLIAVTPMGIVLRVQRADGSSAVLKCLSETGIREETAAPAVLRAYGGRGAVRLLAHGPAALLIEYCAGPQLGWADRGAIPVICDIVRQLHHPAVTAPDGLPDLAQRCRALGAGLAITREPRQRALLDKACRIGADLLASAPPPRLLHGDLHHQNIMQVQRDTGAAWVVIDPQGLIGDPAYEVANIFGNPLDIRAISLDPGRPARLADQFARALDLDRDRLLGWGFVHSCISACWSLEDGGDPGFRLKLAQNILACL